MQTAILRMLQKSFIILFLHFMINIQLFLCYNIRTVMIFYPAKMRFHFTLSTLPNSPNHQGYMTIFLTYNIWNRLFVHFLIEVLNFLLHIQIAPQTHG